MKCPICPSSDLLMTDRLGIEIDYCPQCRGVWLDRGELDKIIERSMGVPLDVVSSPVRPMPSPEPRHYDNRQGGHDEHHDNRHGNQSRKSFWRELFD